MKNKTKKYLTNWVDGMKINKAHFENSEGALIEYIQDTASLQIKDWNYGLINDKYSEGLNSLEVNVLKSPGENYVVSLKRCLAVTYGGKMILIQHGDSMPELSYTVKTNELVSKPGKQSIYYLVLSVDYHSRTPSGEAVATESPLRQPFVRPAYTMEVVNEDAVSAGDLHPNSLIIGRLDSRGNEIIWDKSYIPPVNSIHAHAELLRMFYGLAENLNLLQICLYNIIYKVINKDNKSPLSFNIKLVCERIIFNLSSNFFPLRYTYASRPPIELIASVSEFASFLKMAIDFLPEKEKEDLLLYFKEWSEISPGKFEEYLNEIIEIEYAHYDIHKAFKTAEEFCNVITDLFRKLSELDLIGKRKADKNMVVREINTKQQRKGFKMID